MFRPPQGRLDRPRVREPDGRPDGRARTPVFFFDEELDFENAVKAALRTFPWVCERFTFELTLAKQKRVTKLYNRSESVSSLLSPTATTSHRLFECRDEEGHVGPQWATDLGKLLAEAAADWQLREPRMKFYVIGVDDSEFDRLVEEASKVVGWAHKNLQGEKDWFSGTAEWCVQRFMTKAVPSSTTSQGDE